MSGGVDVMQVFISAFGVFGISLLWVEFTEKVFKTSFGLWDAAFNAPKEEDRSDKEE